MLVKKPANKSSIENIKLHVEDPAAIEKFSWNLIERLHSYGVTNNTHVILLCIGTDRSTGDCLGPLIGTKLSSIDQKFFNIYGTLENPVHASNLDEIIEYICDNYPGAFIIAVDACLGRLENVGCVNIGDGSLQPGAGVNKKLPAVGHIHITGIVNVAGFMEYLVLQNTRLNIVMRMANLVVDGLKFAALNYQKAKIQGS
ncbi:sporulation protein YyaC [Desulfofarcimen acetoxidans DSM 771]|jgi:putative sporulation protein YyaC|uniref:Sporulation protein YyaC n=1 Tax=Desulfofarcimen acetoxidans (strain ATCC 49208 / DSM 771 / KCTC 5769 / VKM B-1644 / 5575) TaxID=485916 RepID=C8W055_DESAS|nr:spore protease YyaC [Desulfofarcimen acetoxidans]ACV65023.1 sporulation protein YyaC [Desulfofarcimen acetoxidans DSM 771]